MGQKNLRWVYSNEDFTYTISPAEGGKFTLSSNTFGIIGTYSSATEAAIALASRHTQNDEWNSLLSSQEVPSSFSDWETDED